MLDLFSVKVKFNYAYKLKDQT